MTAVIDGSSPEQEPIRAEIFGIERLEQHALSLAEAHQAGGRPPRGRPLLPRVRDNAQVLLAGYRDIAATVLAKKPITPAAEWILDNFHVVDEQLRGIRDHLPRSYYRLLPKIAAGHLAGYPRVYGLAWAYVAHTDSRFELETLQRFVQAYQRGQPLTIGEIWAVAIHLRVALVENLRRLSQAINRAREGRARADALADRLLAPGDQPPERSEAALGGLGNALLSRAFAVQLVQRLRGQDPSVTPALAWLETRLGAQGTTADEVVAQEHQAQAAANVTVRNIISSMRWMSSIDWTVFFESVSLVDEVLRQAPGFAAMDFNTRDEYRARIERLSRRSSRSEIEVAQEAVSLAGGVAGAGPASAARLDPGYHLLAGGRRAFERRLGFRVPWSIRIRRAFRAHPLAGYLGSIAVLTALLLASPLFLTFAAGAAPRVLALLALFALVPASEIAIAIVQRLVPWLIPARLLPKLELAGGVPAELRTLVAVPTMIRNQGDIAGQLERLEVHYLANPEGHLHFALLTDWTDAAAETVPGDADLLDAVSAGIARLNARYGSLPGGEARFLLLHRRRLWNPREGKWIGWERKRGKLHELNRLLRGATDTTFVPIGGRAPAVPPGVRYVITLDSDTRLPMGSARRLVGAMAHPLNRPRFDPRKGRVVEGYAIVQPHLTPSLPTGPDSTTLQRILSGPGGVDPYAAAISDVYQDLFGEGSYTGKGIYDVDAFEAALAGRVPENTLLSHDLFESAFARAGLATDVDLFEEFPAHYGVAARQRHRWVRGDWQLLPWILNPRAGLPGHARWKMTDNLRRSLAAPSTFLLAAAAWILPGVPPLGWTALFLGSIVLPAVIPILDGLVPRRRGISKRSHLRAVGNDIQTALAQTLLAITMLAHQAWLMVDAIVRTLWRLGLSRRHLLEWVTAAQAGSGADLKLRSFLRQLAPGVVLAAGAGLLVVLLKPEARLVGLPFVALWVLAPVLAWRISLPPKIASSQVLDSDETRALRMVARRTWRFFERFVDQENHHLPQDNFQEDPEPVAAHRTSPTNLGLYLLSTTVARDFGWIGTLEMLERLEATLRTMADLHRVHGHFVNWYDTRTLRPLEPVYISTVDSGNLAGHLIALAQACRELARRPPIGPEALDGIGDALHLLEDAAAAAGRSRRTPAVTERLLRERVERLSELLASAPASLPEWHGRLDALQSGAVDLATIARGLAIGLEDAAARSGLLTWAAALQDAVRSHRRDFEAASAGARLAAIAARAEDLVGEMDFQVLFDSTRKLFSIGSSVADGRLDPGSYDLLASEARLASFVAVAKGDVPPQHWFLLGRSLTPVGRGAALLSWSGSMFEYLMPLLVMRQPARSLLDLTCRLVVRRQIHYGAERGVPWGISESAYNVRDAELTYQYSDFGVPGLGLKRGLFEDVVVAPYATALAAMLDPRAALHNFSRLEGAGALGPCGFYDALDYTPARLPEGTSVAIVRAFMAHHQGMTIVALGNVVHDEATPRRFHSHPLIQAAELLLEERTPRAVAVARPRAEEVLEAAHVRDLVPPALRRFDSPHDTPPRTHVLSNGRYTVMLTAAGSGFSRWGERAVTRWREDATRDHWGTFVFLRDAGTGAVWSAGFQPCGTEVDRYDVVYSEDRVRITQQDASLSIVLEVVVSHEDDAELRRLTVTNHESRARTIEITSYAEVVLAPQAADEAHPAFSNLFVETEFVATHGALLATRRPRSADEARVWLAHVAASETEPAGPLQFETDRVRFLGRGRGVRTASAVLDGGPLSNTAGTVLDPIVSLRHRMVIPPGGMVRMVFTTLMAPSREQALEIAEKYGQPATFERASALAWTQAQVQLQHLRITQDEAHLFQRLANRLLYADRTLRAGARELASSRGGPGGLWAHGISGDRPIALLRIEREDELEIARQLLRAQEYWRLKGIPADLVILNAQGASYAQNLQHAIEAMARANQPATGTEAQATHGGVFVLREDLLPAPDLAVLRSAARLLIVANRGTLSEQVVRETVPSPAPMPPRRRPARPRPGPAIRPVLDLRFWNGLGGFTPDGREYVTVLDRGQWTPAPWINVVANPDFGFQVSEAGSGHTWSKNSRENKLTPWSNDPVGDPPGETFYVRDEESGALWGPTCLPIREENGAYVIRHGQGYSRFEHVAHDIGLDLLQLVPPADPIKISRLTLRNLSGRRRRLSVTAYVEWVLGVARTGTAPYVVTETDPATGAILARNAWNGEFASRVAFAALGRRPTATTADRLEFLGRNSGPDRPAALEPGRRLSGRIGSGLDPCAALQTIVELEPGESKEVLFLLGQGEGREECGLLIERYRQADGKALLAEVREHWDGLLAAVQVTTPDPAMDLLLNRWLLYQMLSCRLWGRSAFYQAGGAYGFRDQIQDVLAVAATSPELVREHLLRCAARQFKEGDVQHWWHPPTGRGVRTRISDDRLWLPYAVAHYLETTGDESVLDEEIAWLEGARLGEHEQEAYFQPAESEERATLFEHCARALDRSLETGEHGLPLIGAGDWNDGMNRVGHEGRGESVWLAWFLCVNLRQFAAIAGRRGAGERADRWRQKVASLQTAIQKEGWDGAWYRRAFFDDGTPLGSAADEECRIDSIAQSWAVLSGDGDQARARRAMASVEEHLVRRDDRLLLLLAPPFDRLPRDPGYIKGYPPGVRENGGQYTHAAIWSVMAFAALNEGDKAAGLFDLLNPIHHADDAERLRRYRVEPYVVAADVYSEPPHTGRGGWTWYTGAAGWLHRAGLESILGLRKRGASLSIDPCIPRGWKGFEIAWRHGRSLYRITVENPNGVSCGVSRISLDGALLRGGALVPLADDGREHHVQVLLGEIPVNPGRD
ncbi:MAG TPA: glucoamylase family protein [Verrucomicrobiae bacterium]|nr:glucoamylase family protein [Verrucomicrobiae bacterium]